MSHFDVLCVYNKTCEISSTTEIIHLHVHMCQDNESCNEYNTGWFERYLYIIGNGEGISKNYCEVSVSKW